MNGTIQCDDYIIMFTSKNKPFYIDKEDYDKVKDITWHQNDKGYIVGIINGVYIKIHRLIMNCPDGMDVDHIHGKDSRNDNRKSNLRVATRTQNSRNKQIRSNNKSGCTGVSFDNGKQRWRAEIWTPKRIHLGWFKDFSDAVVARKKAEEEIFKEWSYDNSQKSYRQSIEVCVNEQKD